MERDTTGIDGGLGAQSLPGLPRPRAAQVRERDWSNVITAHEGDTRAYVWRLQKYALGEWVLFPPAKQLAGAKEAQVTTVCLR